MTDTGSTAPLTQRLHNHHRQALCTIRDTLPPPLGDIPQGRTEGDEAIDALIARFVPASSVQTERAAMVVTAPSAGRTACVRRGRTSTTRRSTTGGPPGPPRYQARPPGNCGFGLPEAKLVRAIVAGTRPHLDALGAAKAGQRRRS